MTDYTNVPESLHEWARLNEQYDEIDGQTLERGPTADDLNQLDAIYRQIREAWDTAPWKDRQLMNWRMFKQVWRDRVLRPETGEKGTS